MPALNTFLLETTGNFDSGLINQHAKIAKLMPDAGVFSGEALKNGGANGPRFRLIVENEIAPEQQNIDLYSLASEEVTEFRMGIGSMLVFHSSWSSDSYWVRFGTETKLVFDSKQANNQEFLIATPFVPGTYDIQDSGSGARGTMTVTKLKGAGAETSGDYRALRDSGPKFVKITSSGFEPDSIELVADQPVVFIAWKNSRVIGNHKS